MDPVYVVMVNDRHTEPEPFLFSTVVAAIQFARDTAHEWAADPEDIEESDINGWHYHVTYSCEGDSIWVIEKSIDDGAILGAA